jgi:hypothetical protein
LTPLRLSLRLLMQFRPDLVDAARSAIADALRALRQAANGERRRGEAHARVRHSGSPRSGESGIHIR